MADNKKMIKAITSMDEDFTQWYIDVVKKAELYGYANVEGCMMIKPAGYAIQENIQKEVDRRFKKIGVQNVYMPILIPESLLEKERDHMEGLVPGMAQVTHGGLEEPQERMCVRSTSEILSCDFYAKDIHSYRDLPRVYSQRCSVVCWEKTTRLFLRSRGFLWQEGHMVHASVEETEARTIQMLNLYADPCEEMLTISVIKGQRTDRGEFVGAEVTYTIESLTYDGEALQPGTSHNLGDGFTRALDTQPTNEDNTLKYVYQTSWGVNTRIIGAVIVVYDDDSGLVLPPRITSVQAMVVPIQQQKEGALGKAYELKERLIKAGLAVKVDNTSKGPSWKFADCEMRDVPLCVEIGPKDMEKNQAVLVYRDDYGRSFVSLDELGSGAGEILDAIHNAVLEKARRCRDVHTYTAAGWDELVDTISNKPGSVGAMRCGCLKCEGKIEEVTRVISRCIPFRQESLPDKCVCCRRPARKMVYWGKVY